MLPIEHSIVPRKLRASSTAVKPPERECTTSLVPASGRVSQTPGAAIYRDA